MRAGPRASSYAGGSGILARNNFSGRANPTHIFAGQAQGGSMWGGLARFATPTFMKCLKGHLNSILEIKRLFITISIINKDL